MSATSISALAADPTLLEPSSSPPNASFQVTILSVGLVRTMLHPRVSESFRLMVSSLPDARSFFSLWDERASSLQSGLRERYGAASAIWLRSTELACNTRCNLTDCANTNGKDSAFNFVRQATKWRVAYGDLLSWQRAHNAAARWVVKVRPDLLWLERFPLTFLDDDNAVYVPRGVMTRNPHEQRHNDHVFVCAAARCAPYFVAVAENYQNCAGSIAKEDMCDAAYPKARLRFVDVAYTVVRDAREGPQCKRLPCDDSVVRLPSGVTRLQNSYATGCIAPHLVAFYEKCVATACTWSASARDRQPLALRQRYCGTS